MFLVSTTNQMSEKYAGSYLHYSVIDLPVAENQLRSIVASYCKFR